MPLHHQLLLLLPLELALRPPLVSQLDVLLLPLHGCCIRPLLLRGQAVLNNSTRLSNESLQALLLLQLLLYR
jgi:hypothetical protein